MQPRIRAADFAAAEGAASGGGSSARMAVTRRLPARAGAVMKSLFSQGISQPGAGSGLSGLALGGNMSAGLETEELEQPFLQEPWIAASVNMWATTAGMVKMRLWDRDPDEPGAREITANAGGTFGELHRLLSRFNERVSQRDAMRQAGKDTILQGELFWFMFDRAGNPVNTAGFAPDAMMDLPHEIRPIPPELVGDVRDRKNRRRITSWRVPSSLVSPDGGMRQVLWPMSSAFHHYDTENDARPGRGLSRMAQAWGPATSSYIARRYNIVWARNLGDPGGIVKVNGVLTDEEYERTALEVEDEWNDPSMVGGVRVMQGNVDYHEVQARPRDMAFDTLTRVNKLEMSAVFGVPMAVLGDQAENLATFRGHIAIFFEASFKPLLLDGLADALNARLFPRLRPRELRRAHVRFDTETIDKLTVDPQSQGEALSRYVRSAVPINEARILAGFRTDPLPGGDVPMVPTAFSTLEAAQLKSQAAAVDAAIKTGVPAETAWAWVGRDLGGVRLIVPGADLEDEEGSDGKKPDEEANPPTGGDGDGEGEEGGSEAVAEGEDDAEKSAARIETRAIQMSATDEKERRDVERQQAPHRAKMNRELRTVVFRMRSEQLAALDKFASTGRSPSLDAPREPELPVLNSTLLQGFARAMAADALEQADVVRSNPEAMTETILTCGCSIKRALRIEARQAEWVRRHPRLAEVPIETLRFRAECVMRDLSPEQIERLITVQQTKWLEELAAPIAQYSWAAFQDAAASAAASLGVVPIATTDPVLLRQFATKAIEVASASRDQLEARLRSVILETLAGDDVGSLQDVIERNLVDLKESTTGAFNSHRARAQAIAHTEVAGASSNARFETFREQHAAGIVERMLWRTSGRAAVRDGGTVRDSHFDIEAANESRIPGERFSNGLTHPLQPGAPASEVVNCQCFLRAMLAEDQS